MHVLSSSVEISVFNQRLFLLKLLGKQGFSGKARAIIFSGFDYITLIYALPAFAGFLSCLHVVCFNAF